MTESGETFCCPVRAGILLSKSSSATHFEDEQSEFERADVKNVLDILTALDDSVRELKIQETAVV